MRYIYLQIQGNTRPVEIKTIFNLFGQNSKFIFPLLLVALTK
jgi:hypothetical protein